ncbi:VOC family protein [Amycolatopsis sp. YIM 10]|uniref:VOC family protein n=1 Tax=Amycolatopsis sp. YIM 10 TaxID=2653857 RepID=UPI00128FD321|nr:VOC family protein [Amycolatopsis sp. YIM 10]QFU86647.1 Glyoxalase-like domain protein [Amycolatopsis sp. YIM 10]
MSVARVRYLVHDIDTAVAFYTTHVGFEVAMEPNHEFALLVKGALRLTLSAPPVNGTTLPEQNRPAPGGWNRIQLEVDDLAAEAQRLERAGVLARSEIVHSRECQYVLLEDPAGNLVELFETNGFRENVS